MKKRTYIDKPLGDTDYMLEQWGWWRMDGMGVPRYVITDDLALAVDSAIAKLTRRNEQMSLYLWLHFGAKWTMVRIGESGKMSERSAREIIKAGVGWVYGVLQGMSEAA
ncbi:antitermination protein Q [Pseudomonas sp. RGB]|uniref:antitermination protein Q n=1 Tax=Pseudomonas sp. RGB TaxID=2598474 RepID=UPI001190D6F7|nr:antitermination protein Q [Pseudomonas sp. RGB]TVT87919.1 antitermination protein Q [Pseudomonas sp. RGB]